MTTVPTTISAAILETILIRLTALFLTGAAGNAITARHAASTMLAAYHPRTEDELRLAASIISFAFQALEALAQAATPNMPLARILRLRGSAVSLSRESSKAEHRLGQLQKARPAEIQSEPAQPEPKIEKAAALIQDTGKIASAAKAKNLTWTQAYEQRQRDIRIAASVQKAQAKLTSASAVTAPTEVNGIAPSPAQ